MELKIKPFPKNHYPKRGLLIRSDSPLAWLREIESLGIDLNTVQSFAIPSLELNILYGCFLVFGDHAPAEIGKNSYFQCFDQKLFIPENTDFYPKINSEDWKNIDAKYIIMHPDFGLVKLTDTIDWVSIVAESPKTESKLKKPSNGVFIPQKIRSFKVDMNDDELLEQLLAPVTDEEWMKNLPFDLDKLKAGDEAEILKYIEYITKYPERAVYLGIPLDIHATSRGGFGNFDWGMFGDPIAQDTDNSSGGESSPLKMTGSQKIFALFLAVVVIIIFAVDFGKKQAEKEFVAQNSYNGNTAEGSFQKGNDDQALIFESGFTEIDQKIDSMFGRDRRLLIEEYKQKSFSERGMSSMQWQIDEYKAKEREARESLKKVYQKKIEDLVNLQTRKYYRKVLDSIRKDPSNTMNKISKELLADDMKEMKKILLSDSLARVFGTFRETEPKIVFNEYVQERPFDVIGEVPEKKEVSFSEIVWMLLAVVGLVGVYSYFFRKKPLYMGGNYVPDGIKLVLITLLGIILLYIFYPLINSFGYNWLVWLMIIGVIILLYRLFNEDENILKSKKR